MWIEEVKDKKGNNNYKYSERYIDPRTNTRKKVTVTYKNKSRETQKLALLALNEKIDSRLNEKVIKKPNMTFRDLLLEWLPIYKQQVKESTYYPTKNILNTKKISI